MQVAARQRLCKPELADPRAFANLPISELADRAHISKPTVATFFSTATTPPRSPFKKPPTDALATTCDSGKRIGFFARATQASWRKTRSTRFFGWCQHGCLQRYDRYSPVVSRLLHWMILGILATCLALRIGSKLHPRLLEIKNNLRNKRYA